MRESLRPDAEKVIVAQALMELAAATRDHTIDAGVLRVYMPHIDGYTPDEVVDACQQLERDTEWFPKVKELITACSRARRRHQDAALDALAAQAPKQLPTPPDPEIHRKWMATILKTITSGGAQ